MHKNRREFAQYVRDLGCSDNHCAMQAYTKGLFEKKVAPASAVPGPTSGTTDTARLSFTNPADDSSSSGLSPGIASAHPGAAPTSHEGAPVPSTNALIAPAATPTAHGATPSTPGGNDMTPGGAANVVSVLTPGTHTMSFKAGLAAISRTASATPSSFVTTGAPTAAAAAAIGKRFQLIDFTSDCALIIVCYRHACKFR